MPAKPSTWWHHEFLERIANGELMNAICKTDGFPTVRAVQLQRNEDPDFDRQVFIAHQTSTDIYLARMKEITAELKNERKDLTNPEIKAMTAEFNQLAFYAEKLYPKMWGQKMQVDAEVTHKTEKLSIEQQSDKIIEQMPMLQELLRMRGYEIVPTEKVIDQIESKE